MDTVLLVLLAVLSELTTGLVKEHFHVLERKSWSDAQQYCRENYDDLSTVTSMEENRKLVEAAQASGYSWIGLHKRRLSLWSSSQWSDGNDSGFRNWATGQPNYLGSQHCVDVDVHGQWYDYWCMKAMPFFCYDIMLELILVQENKTWEEALEHCRAHHTDLASLTSERELLVAKRRSKDAQATSVWTALRFLAGEWLWVNESPPDSLAVPEGALPQCPARPFHCGARNAEASRWEDRDCEERLNFICY